MNGVCGRLCGASWTPFPPSPLLPFPLQAPAPLLLDEDSLSEVEAGGGTSIPSSPLGGSNQELTRLGRESSQEALRRLPATLRANSQEHLLSPAAALRASGNSQDLSRLSAPQLPSAPTSHASPTRQLLNSVPSRGGSGSLTPNRLSPQPPAASGQLLPSGRTPPPSAARNSPASFGSGTGAPPASPATPGYSPAGGGRSAPSSSTPALSGVAGHYPLAPVVGVLSDDALMVGGGVNVWKSVGGAGDAGHYLAPVTVGFRPLWECDCPALVDVSQHPPHPLAPPPLRPSPPPPPPLILAPPPLMPSSPPPLIHP